MNFSMLGGMFDSIKQIFTEALSLIPKIMYLLYTSLACVLDVLQLFFRKVAGLDVYYVEGTPVSGDLVTNFIGGILGFNEFKEQYSALTTVFWSFVLFGVIMVFISTFVAIIKSHYSYDEKAAKGPMQYVYAGGKALINIAAVPIIVFIGLYVSQALLTAIDSLTSVSNSEIVDLYGSNTTELKKVKTQRGDETYIFYDFFGVNSGVKYNKSSIEVPTEYSLALVGSTTATFSGSMFKVAAFNGNRARTGEFRIQIGANEDEDDFKYTGWPNKSGDFTLFNEAASEEELAEMIDVAFVSNLHLTDCVTLEYGGAVDNIKYLKMFKSTSFVSFSKFNVGLVWYFYDLWQFNFIVGFAGVIVCVTLFINIIMGLITRLFMSLGLFLVAPPLFGLAPMDGGKAAGKWREEFFKQVLMTYGAVVGMNIFFLILPYLNSISFFNIQLADVFVQALIIIVGLVTIKSFIALISGLIGAADANKTGSDISKEVGSVAGKAVKMTAGAAKVAINPGGAVGRAAVGIGQVAVGAAQKVAGFVTNPFGIHTAANKIAENRNKRRGDKAEDLARKSALLQGMNGQNIDRDEFMHRAMDAGLSAKDAKKMYKDIGSPTGGGALNSTIAGNRYLTANHITGAAGFGTAAFNNQADITRYRTRQAVAYQQGARWKAHASWGNKALKSGTDNLGKSGVFSPIQNFGNVVTDNDGWKEFKENAFGKDPNWAKITAQNTEKINTGIGGLHTDIVGSPDGAGGTRGGVMGRLGDINTSVGDMHTDMNAGIGGVRSDLTTIDSDINAASAAAEAELSKIEANTAKIDANTEKIKEKTKQISYRTKIAHNTAKKSLAEQRKAKQDLDKVVKEVKDINKNLK